MHLASTLTGYGRMARLPFIALFAGSCWLMFRLTSRLFGSRAGLWAVLSLNLSAFFTVVAGSWVLPDGPLILCLLGAADQLAALAFNEGAPSGAAWDTVDVRRWIALGLWLGLAGLSKYQAVLFGLGVAAFLLTWAEGRRWLARPGPWLAAVVAAVVASPVLIWNAQHHWASFAFQGGRAAATHGLRPAAVLQALLGQAALLLPWVFVPLALAAWRALRAGPADPRRWLCACLALPAIVLFALTPAWGQTALPHWSMAGWLLLFPLLGDGLAGAAARRRWPIIWARVSAILLGMLWTVLASDAATGWVGRAWPATFTKGDPTLESVEWTPLARRVSHLAVLRQPRAFVVAMKWNEAGRIAPAVGEHTPVVVFSDDPRGLGYARGVGPLAGRDALIVVRPEDLGDGLVRIRPCFASVEPLEVVSFGRLGKPELELHLFAGHDLLPACSELGQPTPAALTQWQALKVRQAAAGHGA